MIFQYSRFHQTSYHHDAQESSGYVRRQSLFSSSENYCNVPSSDYDPTYASIDEYQQQPSFLHNNNNNNNGWGSLNNTG